MMRRLLVVAAGLVLAVMMALAALAQPAETLAIRVHTETRHTDLTHIAQTRYVEIDTIRNGKRISITDRKYPLGTAFDPFPACVYVSHLLFLLSFLIVFVADQRDAFSMHEGELFVRALEASGLMAWVVTIASILFLKETLPVKAAAIAAAIAASNVTISRINDRPWSAATFLLCYLASVGAGTMALLLS